MMVDTNSGPLICVGGNRNRSPKRTSPPPELYLKPAHNVVASSLPWLASGVSKSTSTGVNGSLSALMDMKGRSNGRSSNAWAWADRGGTVKKWVHQLKPGSCTPER